MENKSQKVFLEYLHSFRGLAIILIVLLHSTYSTIFLTNQLGSHKYFEIITQVLLHGSTIFFAVISVGYFRLPREVLCPATDSLRTVVRLKSSVT